MKRSALASLPIGLFSALVWTISSPGGQASRPDPTASADFLLQPRVYVCYRASAPITIDGDLNEKAWWDAPWTEPFQDHQWPHVSLEPIYTARAKVVYDDENLYFAAQLQEPNVWGTITQRDSFHPAIYEDNDFEIFLDPDGDGDEYFEFEVNALNACWDMFHEKEYHRGSTLDTSYDIEGVRHSVKAHGTLNYHYDEDLGWTLEVRWPLENLAHRNDFPLPIRQGKVMRVNFSRVQYYKPDTSGPVTRRFPGQACEDWIWNSTVSGDLHLPEMWGRFVFSDRVAGTGRDRELEESFSLFPPPPGASHRRSEQQDQMVYFPPCTITVGPDPSDEKHSPAHTVAIGGFWMDRYEVTVAEYTEFLNGGGGLEHYHAHMANPECGIAQQDDVYVSAPDREQYPIVYVTHKNAIAYATWAGKQLPTEAQWERAARGLEARTYPWGEEPPDPTRANYDYYYGKALPVGSFPAGRTPEGLYDMAGNVNEWCREWYVAYPGGEEMKYLGMLPGWEWYGGENKVTAHGLRGGAWTGQPLGLKCAYRDADTERPFLSTGFRCVREERSREE